MTTPDELDGAEIERVVALVGSADRIAHILGEVPLSCPDDLLVPTGPKPIHIREYVSEAARLDAIDSFFIEKRERHHPVSIRDSRRKVRRK